MRVAITAAFVLHRRPYRETSLLVEIFSREYGRLGLLARGVRTARSRRGSLLQPFVPLQLGWSGRGELPMLTRVEADGPQLLSPLHDRSLVALYLNELLMRLSARQDPHPELYDAYHGALLELGRSARADAPLRSFELTLLESMGYGLELRHEAHSGNSIRADGSYRYIIEQGPFEASSSSEGIRISGSTLLALANGQLQSVAERREARQLLSLAIGHYLGGRALRTRELLENIQTVRAAGRASTRNPQA